MLASFADLALSRRYAAFGVGAITRAAKVARSTFYYHFAGKDDLLLTNLAPFVTCIAALPGSDTVPAALQAWTAHIWEHRAVAAQLFAGRTGAEIRAAIADAISARLGMEGVSNPGMTAERIAGASMNLLLAWVQHRFSASAEDVTRALGSGVRALSAFSS